MEVYLVSCRNGHSASAPLGEGGKMVQRNKGLGRGGISSLSPSPSPPPLNTYPLPLPISLYFPNINMARPCPWSRGDEEDPERVITIAPLSLIQRPTAASNLIQK